MSHVPTMLKSDRSVFEKMLPVKTMGTRWPGRLAVKSVHPKLEVLHPIWYPLIINLVHPQEPSPFLETKL